MKQRNEIRLSLEKQLSPHRFEHTLGVEYTCCALAMRYEADLEQARLCGLLHDCAKHYSGTQLLEECKKYQLPVNEYEKAFPELLHAKVGAYLAKEQYGVNDSAILDAIACHTTGKPNMTLLEKILYIADYMEPNRDRAPNLSKIRTLAFQDLDACLLEILAGTLRYLETNGSIIDPQTKATYEYYKEYANLKKEETKSIVYDIQRACYLNK